MTIKDKSAVIPPLELQPVQAPVEAKFYQLDELVCYHDRTFIAYAYAALSKRAPTLEELAGELDGLRSGRRDKVDIIEGLLRSNDRKPSVKVVGLRGRALRRASNWPVIGYAWRLLRGLSSVPLHLKHQQRFEAYALGQQQKIADHVNGVIAPALADSIDVVLMLSESLQDHAVSFEEALAFVAAQQERLESKLNAHREELEAKVSTQQEHLAASVSAHRQELDERLNAQQEHLEASVCAHRQELDERLNAQQELIVQEQQVIVETQKVVMEDLRAEILAVATIYEQRTAEIMEQLRRLQTTVESARAPQQAPSRK
jgi:hypothetical protein